MSIPILFIWEEMDNMKKYDNCIGEIYGKLTVVGKAVRPNGLKYGGDDWIKCKCECGNESTIPYRAVMYKNTKSCGCIGKARGPNHRDWRGCGEISADYFGTCKRRALGGGVLNRTPKEFSVTIEYLWELFLKQNRICAISGLVLTFDPYGSGKKRKETNKVTASLDRIDSSKGYVDGNVQWIHKHINIMKNDLPQSKFIEYCKIISKNNT